MEWEEVANVVSDERTAQRCSPLEDNDIAQAEQILVLGLDRLDIPSAAPELGPILGSSISSRRSFSKPAPAAAAPRGAWRGERPPG